MEKQQACNHKDHQVVLLCQSYWAVDTETQLVGQAGSEMFNEAEVKTRKSRNTAEAQTAGRQFSSVSGIKPTTPWESLIEKQTAGALTKTTSDLAQTGRRPRLK